MNDFAYHVTPIKYAKAGLANEPAHITRQGVDYQHLPRPLSFGFGVL